VRYLGLTIVLAGLALFTLTVMPEAQGQGTTYPVRMNVFSDPGFHAQDIDMPPNITLKLSAFGINDIVEAPPPFVDVVGDLGPVDPFTGVQAFAGESSGTVTGIPGVDVELTLVINHHNGEIGGFYRMGTGGELPGGQAIEYRIKGKEATATPVTVTPSPTSTSAATPTPTPTATPGPRSRTLLSTSWPIRRTSSPRSRCPPTSR